MVQCMLADIDNSLFLVIGAVGASLWGLLYTLMQFYRIRQREQTRREIAAYVAEGSITPSDGEKLMRAAAYDPEAESAARVVVEAGMREA